MDTQELLAREEIRATLTLYNKGGDAADYGLLASAFHEDGALVMGDGSIRLSGRAEISGELLRRARLRGHGTAGVFQRHNLTTNRIDVLSANEAAVRTTYLVVTELGPDHAGEYIDRFEKRADRWLIAERRATLDWMRSDSRFCK